LSEATVVDSSEIVGVVTVSSSAVSVGSWLGSSVGEDSPAEKEDGGTGDSLPFDSSISREQEINIAANPAMMAITANKTLAFLILCTAFHTSILAELR
jgi:hypothetical protein